MLFHFFFIIVYLVLGLNVDPAIMNYLLIIQCSIATYLRSQEKNEIISPLVIFYISSIMVSMGNIKLLSIIGTAENTSYSYVVPRYLPDACIIWCVGASLMFIGYLALERFSAGKIRYDLNIKASDIFFQVVVILSLLSPTIRANLKSLGSITKLVSLSGAIGILYFSRLWAVENSNKYRNYAIILFLIQSYNALLFAWVRFELIQPTLVMLLGYLAGKNSFKSALSFRMIPFLILVAAFIGSFSTLSKYRANYAKGIMHELFAEKVEQNTFNYDEDNKTSFVTRLSCMAQVTNIVKLVQNNGYYNGAASYPIALALIPRFLWPEKPSIELGLWYALEIGAAYKEQGKRGNNSINMTVMGQLFLDFGWPGMIIGCLLFGGYVALLWNSVDFFKYNNNILGILYGGYLLVYSFYAPTL
ncbi:MAG: hypothetical protein EBZ77_11140, partial [Chitinophagia bacterium]|nr:hypothetical protein [Chitinophagia bacterium]